MSRAAESAALRDAREAVGRYADAWRTHKRDCARCTRSVHARGVEPCRSGRSLISGRQAAEARLEIARRAEAAPVPGQGELEL